MPKRTTRKVAPPAEPAPLPSPPEQYVTQEEISSKSAFGDRVSAGFAELYGSELLCDFKISCGGEELPVHSVVLYSQSRFFRELFKSNMRERLLHLDEFAPVVKSLLEYFYTGDYTLHQTPQPMAHHASLIIAAKKFDVGGLDALALRRFLDEGEVFSSSSNSDPTFESDSADYATADFFTAAKIIYHSAGTDADDNEFMTAQVLAIASKKMQSLTPEAQTRWVAHLIEVPALAVAFTMKQHTLLQAYEGKPAVVMAGRASPKKKVEEKVVVEKVVAPASPRKRGKQSKMEPVQVVMEEMEMMAPVLEPVGELHDGVDDLFED